MPRVKRSQGSVKRQNEESKKEPEVSKVIKRKRRSSVKPSGSSVDSALSAKQGVKVRSSKNIQWYKDYKAGLRWGVVWLLVFFCLGCFCVCSFNLLTDYISDGGSTKDTWVGSKQERIEVAIILNDIATRLDKGELVDNKDSLAEARSNVYPVVEDWDIWSDWLDELFKDKEQLASRLRERANSYLSVSFLLEGGITSGQVKANDTWSDAESCAVLVQEKESEEQRGAIDEDSTIEGQDTESKEQHKEESVSVNSDRDNDERFNRLVNEIKKSDEEPPAELYKDESFVVGDYGDDGLTVDFARSDVDKSSNVFSTASNNSEQVQQNSASRGHNEAVNAIVRKAPAIGSQYYGTYGSQYYGNCQSGQCRSRWNRW